eukprot:15349455-Ditylum_brightwellii.AAC.1
MEEMRIRSKKHKKKKATPTKIPASPTNEILGGITTIRKEDHSKPGYSLSKIRQNAIVRLSKKFAMATLTDGAKQLKKMYNTTMRVAAVKQHLQEHNMLNVFLLLMLDGKRVKHKQ